MDSMVGQVVIYMENGDFVTQSVHLTWRNKDLIVWPNPIKFNGYNEGGLILGADVYFHDQTIKIKGISGQIAPPNQPIALGFPGSKICTILSFLR